MLDRLLLVALLALAVIAGVVLMRALGRARGSQLRRADPADLWSALGARPDGRPAVVVFSTPGCIACRTAQQPAIDALRGPDGGVRTLHVDIAHRPDAARAFKVLTAPSTAVLAGDGSLHSLNHGFASTDQLAAQLSAAAGWPASTASARQPGLRAPSAPAPGARR